MNTIIASEIFNKINDVFGHKIDNIILEDGITYDNDDYYVWGTVYYSVPENTIKTTKYGHNLGLSDVLSDYVTYDEVVKKIGTSAELERMIKLAGIKIFLADKSLNSAYNIYNLPRHQKIGIPCSVHRGRKIKGDNLVLIEVVTERDYFGRDYLMAIVADPEKKIFSKVNADYVEMNSEAINKAINNIDNIDITEIPLERVYHTFAYRMSYAACDADYEKISIKKILNSINLFNLVEVPEFDTYKDPWQEKLDNKKKAKLQTKYDEALPRVTAWANEKFGSTKNTEEIQEIIDKTMKKYYSC